MSQTWASGPTVTLKCRVCTVYGSVALLAGAVASAMPPSDSSVRARVVMTVTNRRIAPQRGGEGSGYVSVTSPGRPWNERGAKLVDQSTTTTGRGLHGVRHLHRRRRHA